MKCNSFVHLSKYNQVVHPYNKDKEWYVLSLLFESQHCGDTKCVPFPTDHNFIDYGTYYGVKYTLHKWWVCQKNINRRRQCFNIFAIYITILYTMARIASNFSRSPHNDETVNVFQFILHHKKKAIDSRQVFHEKYMSRKGSTYRVSETKPVKFD